MSSSSLLLLLYSLELSDYFAWLLSNVVGIGYPLIEDDVTQAFSLKKNVAESSTRNGVINSCSMFDLISVNTSVAAMEATFSSTYSSSFLEDVR